MNHKATSGHAPLNHDRADAIAAYALGVLDRDERQELDAHLAGCPACRAALVEHEEVVGTLGTIVPPVAPSPELRGRLLAEVRAPAPPPAGLVAERHRARTVGLGMVATVALVAIVVLGLLLARTVEQRDDARYAEQEIAEYLRDGGTLSPLLPAPNAPPDAAPGHGSLAVVPDGSQAMLVLYDVQRSGDGRRYLAWMEGDGERIELGELRVNDDGIGWLVFSSPEPMPTYERVGITRVSADAPEGEPFLVAPVG